MGYVIDGMGDDLFAMRVTGVGISWPPMNAD
jgi:hypothetical protein